MLHHHEHMSCVFRVVVHGNLTHQSSDLSSLPIPRNLRLTVPRDLQKVRRPLPLQGSPPVVERQPLIGRVLPRGLLVREWVRPLLLLRLHGHLLELLWHLLHGHRARGGARLYKCRRELRLLELHVQLLVLHLCLLPDVCGETCVVEHHRDLVDLRL